MRKYPLETFRVLATRVWHLEPLVVWRQRGAMQRLPEGSTLRRFVMKSLNAVDCPETMPGAGDHSVPIDRPIPAVGGGAAMRPSDFTRPGHAAAARQGHALCTGTQTWPRLRSGYHAPRPMTISCSRQGTCNDSAFNGNRGPDPRYCCCGINLCGQTMPAQSWARHN